MAKEITPYIPDLAKIEKHSKDLNPLILDNQEYTEILEEHQLYRGTNLSDEGILRCMEAGLIKIKDPDKPVNILKAIQSCSLDMNLGSEFWHYRQHEISRLTLDQHRQDIEELELLEYNYKNPGSIFVFHPNSLVLAFTQEMVSLSNVIKGSFDGRSKAGRLGISNHQTAGLIQPGFAGQIMMEFSNTNALDIALPVGCGIASLSFSLLDRPSTRPEAFSQTSESKAFMQTGPFGFRLESWDRERSKARRNYLLNSKSNNTSIINGR